MAIYFDMAICAGRSEAAAIEVADHMAKLDCLIDHWKGKAYLDQFGAWWTSAVPKNMGWGVPYDDDKPYLTEEQKRPILNQIYDHLRQIGKYELAVMAARLATELWIWMIV